MAKVYKGDIVNSVVELNLDDEAAGGGNGGTVQGTDATYDIQAANEGATPGNARGENSVDLQTKRALATQIASGNYSTISGGHDNKVSGSSSTTSGGYDNTASGNYSTIGGGSANEAIGHHSAVGGGRDNTARGHNATIGGGFNNYANGNYSWAGGKNADTGTLNHGSFAWADSTTASTTVIPNAADQFAIKAAGGLRLIDGNQGANKVLTCDADGVGTWQAAAGGGGGHTIQDEGVAETTRTNLNFVGTGIDVTDDAGNDATVVTIDPIPVEINDLTDVNTSGSETLSITGTLSPDATGTYTLAGTHNGENYYTNGTYFVWNDGAGAWYLDNATSVQGGDETAAWSIGGFSPVNSTYIPLTGATGNATVTLNPAAGPAEGDVLSWDDTAGEWVTGAPAVGGGSVASDTIWDVAGDLAIGSGTDTASRLAIGTEGQVLTVSVGAVTWSDAGGGGSGGTVQTPSTLQIRATDEGTTAGNARAANSVDLQTKRELATQIAGGLHSTISGGLNNTASGTHSTVSGGYDNTASDNSSTVSGGRDNDAIGSYCTVGGGYNNDASGIYYSTVSGGLSNTASGYTSTIGGGRLNTADGRYSTVSGGIEAKADKFGQQAYSAGQFASQGDAQTSLMVVRNQTNDATQTELYLNGSFLPGERMTIADDTTWFFEINLVARRTDVNDESAIYKFEGAIDRNTGAASTTLVGTVAKTVYSEDTPAWDATVEADTTNGALVIKVTGESPKVINWVARVETTEVTG